MLSFSITVTKPLFPFKHVCELKYMNISLIRGYSSRDLKQRKGSYTNQLISETPCTGCSLKITLLLRHNISRHPSVSIGEESLLHAYVNNTEYKCTLMFILKCKQNIHEMYSLIGALIYLFLRGRDY